MARTTSSSAQAPRDPSHKALDIETVRAIAQAAVDVELFTIPLYMTSLYSIEGYHQIGVKGSALYEGRQWPGAGTTAEPQTANEQAFNIVFSIFIQEMLHLQMAANMASGIGVAPCFTSYALQNDGHGWTCYGPDNRIIPHIIDLADTKADHLRVNIGPLDAERLELFLAIEQPEDRAKAAIKPDRIHKYFPKAPFTRCSPYEPLPLFGTIGHMYQCYYDYLMLSYTDGTQLWQSFFPAGTQRDLFNGGAAKEYPGVGLALDPLGQMLEMMDAITDQGEGNILQRKPQMYAAVMPKFQPSLDAMSQNNPTYSDTGELLPQSSDANARFANDSLDHFERFEILRGMLPEITTWATAGRTGKWTAEDFQAPNYDPNHNPYDLPSTEDIADAMNQIATGPEAEANFRLLSQSVVGAIAGVTTVLNDYWKDPSAGFPMPAMGGTKDRMSAAWSCFGRTPDLSLGLEPLPQGVLGHACQGLDFNVDGANNCAQVQVFHSCIGSNSCRAQGGCGFVNLVAGGGGSCGGSCSSGGGGASGGGSGGTCRSLKAAPGAPGPMPQAVGCGRTGDVRPAGGKVLCGAPPTPAPSPGTCGAPTPAPSPGTCGAPPTPAPSPGRCGAPPSPPSPPAPPAGKYSAPGDNKCGGFGGCAVPISAAQLYPKLKDGSSGGTMEVFDFQESTPGAGDWHSVPIDTVPFKEGDKVADIAYQAFAKVMQHRGKTPPEPAPPSMLRLVFPPST